MPRIHSHPSAHPVTPASPRPVTTPDKPATRGTASLDAFIHTPAEVDKPDRMGTYPSLDQMFARSMPLGGFSSNLGKGELATERIGDNLRLYLKTTGGFSFADNTAFRDEAARRYDPVATSGMSEAMFDDPRTSVRFVIGPKDFPPGTQPKTIDVRPANNKYAFASIPVSELKGLSQGKGLALYAEVTAPDWQGGSQHAFVNLGGHSYSNFEIPAGLVE